MIVGFRSLTMKKSRWWLLMVSIKANCYQSIDFVQSGVQTELLKRFYIHEKLWNQNVQQLCDNHWILLNHVCLLQPGLATGSVNQLDRHQQLTKDCFATPHQIRQRHWRYDLCNTIFKEEHWKKNNSDFVNENRARQMLVAVPGMSLSRLKAAMNLDLLAIW